MEDLLDRNEWMSDRGMATVVNRTVAMLKASALRACMASVDSHYRLPADPSSLEQIFARRLATRPAAAQSRAVAHAKRALASTGRVRARLLGDLAALDLRSADSVADRASHAAIAAALSDDERAATVRLARPAPPAPPPAPPGPGAKLLSVRLRAVVCADETDGFLGSEAGHDEIALGGVSVDETGDSKKVSAFTVGTNFDDGDVKVYNPPKEFCSFSITEGQHWPKPYVVTFYLAELDNGGFPGFLKEVLDQVKTYLLTFVGSAIGTALGPLGNVIGAAVGLILDLFINWLIAIWEDDIFPPITVYANISSPHHKFASGTQTSGVKKYWTKAHGGKYWLHFDWHLH
jgi:hypothetical protein